MSNESKPVPVSLTSDDVRLLGDALEAYRYATTGSFEPDAKEEIERATALERRIKDAAESQAEPLALPTVHLNGTSRQGLLDGYCEVKAALQFALDKLQEHYPNGRDYPTGNYDQARAQHIARCANVRQAMNDIDQIMEHVADDA